MMLFLILFVVLTVLAIVVLYRKRVEKRELPRVVEIEDEEPSVYWMPWSWGFGGGSSYVNREVPHFAGLGTREEMKRVQAHD